uniref:extensin-like n=1 Tax=Solea senegalensis TaxID=28829 RepID=UPI001CD82DB8|nr:extensin-like [Solea senegalensis]
MPHSHSPPAKKGATRPGQGHAMASHERRRGGGPDIPTPDQKTPAPPTAQEQSRPGPRSTPSPTPRVPKARRPPACPPPCPPQGTEDAQVRSRAQQEHSSVYRPATPEGRTQGGSPPPHYGPTPPPSAPQAPAYRDPDPLPPPAVRRQPSPSPRPTTPNPHGPPRPRWQPPHKSTPTPVGQTHNHRGTVDPGPPTHTDHQTPQMHGPQHHRPTREDTVTNPP